MSENHQTIPSCPGCGSNGLEFQPSTQVLCCKYCQHTTEPIEGVQAGASAEMALDQGMAAFEASMQTQNVQSVHCPGCGSQLVKDAGASAFACPYCGTNLASADSEKVITMHPGWILPFTEDRTRARNALTEWQSKRWFAPQSFKKLSVDNTRISGVYLPYWTFDANVSCSYQGEKGREKPNQDKNSNSKQYDWTSCSGHVNSWFDDILVPASEKIPTYLQRAFVSWDTSRLLAWDARYLAGFQEAISTVQISRAHSQAREIMRDRLKGLIEKDIGGDAQRVHRMDPQWSKECFRLIQVPVWVYHFHHKNENHLVLINGRNGKVYGERPYSVGKILGFIALIIAILFLLFRNGG